MACTSSASPKATVRRSAASSSPVSRRAAAAALAAALAAGAPFFAAAPEDRPAPYIVLTRDGHRIDATEKPVVEGERVRIRLAPGGALAVLPAGSVDWEATERYNAPPPPAAARPAPEPPRAEVEAPASGAQAPGAGLLKMTIIGKKWGLAAAPPAAEPAAAGDAAAGGRAAAPAAPANPNQAAASALAMLAREMTGLRAATQELTASRSRLEEEIARLEARAAKGSPTDALHAYESPTRRAIERARQNLQAVQDQIARIEGRMSEIRYQAVQAGGTVE